MPQSALPPKNPATAAAAPRPPAVALPAQPRFVVVLDAAHGGDDGGAQLDGSVAEKTLTLSLSVRLRSLLTARGIQVVTTRESNATVPADTRAQIANHASASACISLHATQTGSGVHLFVSSLPATPVSRFQPWKTAQSGYVTRSLRLASVVNSALEQGSDSGPIPVTLARTTLPGVDSMACPALAVELAPIRGTGGKDSAASTGVSPVTTRVSDSEYQSQIVQALAAALMEWKTDAQGDAGGDRQP
jgi:N-acetylmuramoyl-L-alanine amidase